METKFEFKPITGTGDIDIAAEIIARANRPVAKALKLNPENAPTNPAFITPEKLSQQITEERHFFLMYAAGTPVGTIAIEPAPDDPSLFYLERLAVSPDAQKMGCGKALMEFAYGEILRMGGRYASVAVINENIPLKGWYEKLGYKVTGTKVFDHLPFTVCFMQKELA